MKKSGITLLEIIISIAIIGVLVSITLTAIRAVRLASERLRSSDHLRQIIIATHQFASDHNDRVPSKVNWNPTRFNKDDTGLVFVELAPYLQIILRENPFQDYPPIARVRAYTDPADPSVAYDPEKEGPRYPNCSYAYSVVGSTGVCTLNSFYGDGTSNTIAFTTHYMLCGVGNRQYGFDWTLGSSPSDYYERRATFADEWYLDVVPVTRAAGGGNVTIPSRAGATFQVKPKLEDCDPYIPQGLHYGGLHSAMFDGSVKFWRSGVRPQVFWAAVTPNGNETDFD
jgi:prepilin-type N-terminal cleavage/methylation domain-containing protein